MVRKDFITLMKIQHCVHDHDHDYVRVHDRDHENGRDHVHVNDRDCDYVHESTFWVQLIIYVQIQSVIFNEEVEPFVVINV